MSGPTLLTLPKHLLQAIQDILDEENLAKFPKDLRDGLGTALQAAKEQTDSESPDQGVEGGVLAEGEASDQEEGRAPIVTAPTIDVELVERLSSWAISDAGEEELKSRGLDTGKYGLIALLAGTEVMVPEAQRRAMDNQGAEDKVDPFLPAYLSPAPPSLGKELRHLSSSLTTVLNVLFSIFGSAAAVYVASVSGAGYSRETAVVLAVLAGVVVGIAEGVLVWIFGDRLKKGREASRKTAREMAKGSGAISEREIKDSQVADGRSDSQGKDENQATPVRIESSSTAPRAATAGIRLRRKALHESQAVA